MAKCDGVMCDHEVTPAQGYVVIGDEHYCLDCFLIKAAHVMRDRDAVIARFQHIIHEKTDTIVDLGKRLTEAELRYASIVKVQPEDKI